MADILARGCCHKPLSENAFHQLVSHIQDFIRQELSTHSSPLKSSVGVCTWNSVYLSARIRYIAISCRKYRMAGSYISNFLIGENVTGTMPKISNQALFPTVLALSIAKLKPLSNRNLATSRLTLFLAKTRSHSCLIIVDKSLKKVIIRKLPNKRTETVFTAFRDIEANTFCKFKTMTADNGHEFAMHEQITQITGAQVYFALPLSFLEHINGLIRRFYQKGTDFSQVSHRKIAELEHILNTSVRK